MQIDLSADFRKPDTGDYVPRQTISIRSIICFDNADAGRTESKILDRVLAMLAC
jgi:hypothetical protein